MKKIVFILFLVLINTNANANSNDSYFENCNNYLSNIMLSETPDDVSIIEKITYDADNQSSIKNTNFDSRYSLDVYNYKCIKDSIEFKDSKISEIYNNLLSIYQPEENERVNFLPKEYPLKNMKYSIYNMDINIISNQNILDIKINIQNSKAVSRILVENKDKNVIIKNIDIQNLFVNLYNILTYEEYKKNKNKKDNKCIFNDQILNYSRPVGSYSSISDIKWYCYPIYMDNKLLNNNKTIKPNIPYITNILHDRVAIIKNTTINKVYKMFKKNKFFGIYTPLFPDKIEKNEFIQHYYFNKNTKKIEILSKEPDDDMPYEPTEYVVISYYKLDNILKFTLTTSSSDVDTYSLGAYKSYLLEQIGSDVKIIEFLSND